ncbi:hypothetical protein [Subtercola vilae]|uniref:Uncharacterized protein n=1 Tax=Subtercola vilae TaxID=2056433 RepID=A0A4V4REG8_9MICO|nr:hypothetical protein [Subtercola vilae]TIH33814.1 hypothetical protein D4765_14130 [Subtercola vilae]
MKRIIITVSDTQHPLAQDQDIDTIEALALAAVRGGGDIVKVTLYGNRELSILVSPGVPITFVVSEVPEEDRDDGDLDSPFVPGSDFDNDYEG